MNIIQDRATIKYCKPILGIAILTTKKVFYLHQKNLSDLD